MHYDNAAAKKLFDGLKKIVRRQSVKTVNGCFICKGAYEDKETQGMTCRHSAIWRKWKAWTAEGEIFRLLKSRGHTSSFLAHGKGEWFFSDWGNDKAKATVPPWCGNWRLFDVLSGESPIGDKGHRMRLFLTEAGYKKALENQDRSFIQILNHARVSQGHLRYDRLDGER